MQTEDYDQLDELSKDTLKSYISKADKQANKASNSYASAASRRHDFAADTPAMAKNAKKFEKRDAGADLARTKLTKEDTMLTYSEFMAQLAESKADDLRDKLAADREARKDAYDYSKEKTAKKNPVTKVKGHSYGAGEEDGEAEKHEPAEPADKRGRGRPAGSKSGARV